MPGANPDEARQLMLAAGLEPLTPYPGRTAAPWLCRCLGCGATVSPTRSRVQQGFRGCRSCGRKRRHEREVSLGAPAAEAELLAAGVEPLEPFPGITAKWRARCTACGTEVSPRLMDIRGGHAGCMPCARSVASLAQRTDEETARQIMRRNGLDPLVPYPGAGKPWRSCCLACGRQVSPRLQKVREGQGCRFCAKRGFDLAAPGRVYVLAHGGLNAVKIGITGCQTDRLTKFAKRGWQVVRLFGFEDGRAAAEVESLALAHIRGELGLTAYLNAASMEGVGGSTETFDADLLSPASLARLVESISAGQRDTVIDS